MKEAKTLFEQAYNLDCSKFIEKKKSAGSQELSYLSWAYAWANFKMIYPDATYTVVKFNGLPYVYDANTGIMVYTNVTANGTTYEMWLPVMDGSNKAMRLEAYTYKVKNFRTNAFEDKVVKAADMFDVNKTIMRCLTKNLAMFGLGLSIYAGEDIPQPLTPEENEALLQEVRSVPSVEIPAEVTEVQDIAPMPQATDIKEILERAKTFTDADEAKAYYNSLRMTLSEMDRNLLLATIKKLDCVQLKMKEARK